MTRSRGITRTVARRPARSALSALGLAAVLLLSGCGSMHPGSAAVVGSHSIPNQEVDDLALGLCSANLGTAKAQGQPVPDVASRTARQTALEVLVNSELATQFGAHEGVTANQQQVSEAVARNAPVLKLLPEDQRAEFNKVVKEYAEARLMTIEIGRRSLADQGKPNVPDEQALAEGQRLLDKYVKTVDVEVDPRYGDFVGGRFVAGGSSLSVPVSTRARQGSSGDPGSSWISGLPASQKCS